MTMEEYPVIIVGAGPAGATCGRALKQEGIEALLVEKKKLPRHKTCTGLLLGQAQALIKEYFGEVTPKDVLSDPGTVTAANVLEWKKDLEFVSAPMELAMDGEAFSNIYLNVWRDKFDYWLLEKSGVPFEDDCAFSGFSMENRMIKVRLSEKGKTDRDVYCSYLVVADGGNTRIRKTLDPTSAEEEPLILSVYQTYYRVADMGDLKGANCYLFLEREFGDIFTLVHRKDEFLASSVGCLKDSGRSPKKDMERLRLFLAEEFRVVLGGLEREEGCMVRIEPPYLGKDTVLLAGGAAGLVYLDGEGICPAIDSGYKAGKAIARGIMEGKNALDEYNLETERILDHMQLCAEKTRIVL
jgi:flavin-dependent dehydrogenase